MILAEPILAGAAAACLLLGIGVGAWAGWPRTGTAGAAAAAIFALALGGLVLSLSRQVPGRSGFWLDATAPMLVAYLAGCLAGAVLRAARR